MFWSNVQRSVISSQYDWGNYSHVMYGDSGRGRWPLNIAIPPSTTIDVVERTVLPVSVTTTKTGGLRFMKDDGFMYVAIDTMGAYIKNADGYVSVLNPELVALLGIGNSAFGLAGRAGNAEAAVFRAKPGAVFRIVPTRGRSSMACVREKIVDFFEPDAIDPAIDNGILDVPPTWRHDLSMWTRIRELKITR